MDTSEPVLHQLNPGAARLAASSSLITSPAPPYVSVEPNPSTTKASVVLQSSKAEEINIFRKKNQHLGVRRAQKKRKQAAVKKALEHAEKQNSRAAAKQARKEQKQMLKALY
eukprot:TRINITY_DN10117_c0_g1_i2.p1 TRINITY_DN10117_c0_g1~~TRINITY_DN10117_c0_g1_i2.p1  ORF type:complete len:112 (+),score=32.08 TRINITY_DN10117_c0_g1_i2:221-556(+)